jgi:26S proteasome regulatory subunit N8
LALPTQAFNAVEEITKEGNIIKSFVHIHSTVQAFEPEEIGVEHLLREIKEISLNSLSNELS